MNHSMSLTKLLPALHKAKQEFQPALKTAINPHFKSKYVDLASVIEATNEALAANDLIVMQGGEPNEGLTPTLTLTTRLFHVSGEWIESHLTLPAGTSQRFDAQTVGSAMTYARRYSYMAILGVAGEDDDGSTASSKHATEDAVLDKHNPKIEQQAQRLAAQPAPESKLTRELKASIELRKQQQANPEITDDDLPDSFADDIPDDVYDQRPAPAPMPVASPKRDQGPVISEAQSKRFFAIAMKGGKSKEDINEALRLIGCQRSTDIPRSRYEEMCNWAAL